MKLTGEVWRTRCIATIHADGNRKVIAVNTGLACVAERTGFTKPARTIVTVEKVTIAGPIDIAGAGLAKTIFVTSETKIRIAALVVSFTGYAFPSIASPFV